MRQAVIFQMDEGSCSTYIGVSSLDVLPQDRRRAAVLFLVDSVAKLSAAFISNMV